MRFRKNKKFIDPRYFLDETTYRDEINGDAPLLEFGSGRNPPGPENRAEYALTWALGQRGGSGLTGQEITLDDIISLLTSPSVAEVYQRLQNSRDQSPFTPEHAVNHVKRLLSPRGQQMRGAHATGTAFGVVQPDHETGDKKSDGLIYYFSPGIKDPTKIIWHGTGKQGGEAPRFKESQIDEGSFSVSGPDPKDALSTHDLFKLMKAGISPDELSGVNNTNLTPEMKSILGHSDAEDPTKRDYRYDDSHHDEGF